MDRTQLIRSQNLLLRRTDNGRLAYHALFGNLSWLDAELYNFLESCDAPLTYRQLARRAGSEVADALLNAYFFVCSPQEERKLIGEWLTERQRLIPTGYYVRGLQISASNACNFACSYCFADTSDKRSHVRREIARGRPNVSFELASNAIRRVLGLAKSHAHEGIAVKFLGREPLLNWKVIKRLLSVFDDDSITWAITTNGSLLTDAIARVLKQHDVLVVVSLDGPPDVNDRLRVLKSNSGPTYAATERALEILGTVGHRFGVSSVVSSATDFQEMHAFVDRLIELGTKELELSLVMQTTDLRCQEQFADKNELAKRLVELYEHASQARILVHGDWVDPFHRILSTHKHRHEDRIERPLPDGCSATSHQISIEPSGDLFPCRAMSTHYGHIEDLQSVLSGDSYRRVAMRTYFNVPFCRGCQLEGFCQGTCLGSLEEASRDIYSPQEEYCNIYRLATERLLATLKCPLGGDAQV